MQHALPDHLTGTVLEGRYELGPRIARGGTATVYRAVDTRLQRVVAVKLMHAHLAEDPDDAAETRARIRGLEESLDQCWDLLRQRRAREEFGEDPDAAGARPVPQVEGYLQ